MNDKATERTYVWAKGETYSFQNWDLWEPWDWGGDCAVALRSSGKWEMNDCNDNTNNGALCMTGTSESVGVGPTPPPPPVSNYDWGKAWDQSACTMQTLTKTGYGNFYGSSCCEACQVLSFSSPLDKISWKGKQCRCVGTTLDTCNSNHRQTRSGWSSADCTQWQPGRRRRQLEEGSQHYSSEVLERFDDVDILAAAQRLREKRSVDPITERQVTCESLWGGSALYWKYDYQVPSSCWSESHSVKERR